MRMMVAKNANVEKSICGIIAPGEKAGSAVAAPVMTHQIPKMMMIPIGTRLPRITPTLENFAVTSGPK